MKLKPLNDRVLVKRLESEEKTAGGLYIPIQPRKNHLRARLLPLVLANLTNKANASP